jgi:hypothetical protein
MPALLHCVFLSAGNTYGPELVPGEPLLRALAPAEVTIEVPPLESLPPEQLPLAASAMTTTPIARRNDLFDSMQALLHMDSLGNMLNMIVIQLLHWQSILPRIYRKRAAASACS